MFGWLAHVHIVRENQKPFLLLLALLYSTILNVLFSFRHLKCSFHDCIAHIIFIFTHLRSLLSLFDVHACYKDYDYSTFSPAFICLFLLLQLWDEMRWEGMRCRHTQATSDWIACNAKMELSNIVASFLQKTWFLLPWQLYNVCTFCMFALTRVGSGCSINNVVLVLVVLLI